MRPIGDLVDEYIRSLTEVSECTRANYAVALKKFLRSDIDVDESMLQKFDLAIAQGSYEWRQGEMRAYARATRRVYVTALSQFMVWLDANDELSANFRYTKALAKLKVQRGRRHRPYVPRFPDPRLPDLVAHFDQIPLPDAPDAGVRLHNHRLTILRNRALAHVLISTGTRISEALSLMRTQIQDGRASECQVIGKGGKPGPIFFDEAARVALQAYLTERVDRLPWVFVSHSLRGTSNQRQMTRCDAWRVIKAGAQACGLDPNTSPHMFRHWLAEDMLDSGSNIEIVQACLHHSSADTTSTIYAHVRDRRLRAGVQAYRAGVPASSETVQTTNTAALVDQVVVKVLDQLTKSDLVGRLVEALTQAGRDERTISAEMVPGQD